MYRNILKSCRTAAILALIVVACKKDENTGINFNSQIDTHNQASIKGDRYTMQLWFSTDGGPYSSSPKFSEGKKYNVKIMDLTTQEFLTADNFQFDWSKSSPAPSDATSDNPEFTFNNNAKLNVYIDDKHCAVDPAGVSGAYHGAEGAVKVNGGPGFNGSNDAMIVSADPANTAGGVLITNLFGDGAGVTFTGVLTSTTSHDQVLTVPSQSTSEGGTVSGTGTFDQCSAAEDACSCL